MNLQRNRLSCNDGSLSGQTVVGCSPNRKRCQRAIAGGSATGPIRGLPSSPLVGVASDTDVATRDADVIEAALMKSADVSRVNFGWIAILVS